MPQTTVSVQQARETAQTMGDLAASAIHPIADALDLVSQDAAVEWRMREVRQLADTIVKLAAPTLPKGSTGPAVYTRTSRQRPDGTFKTHVRSGYARGATTPEPDLSTPASSCDAPSCGCVDGEDCRANVAAEAHRAADRVMVRAVRRQLGDGHRDDDGNTVWVIDRTATAHGAPFSRGDIVIDSDGWSGFREVLEVRLHPSEQRLLRLVVRRVDGLVFDEEEF